jgi:transcriptional regulator with XRE-family HTH domain
MFAWLTFGDLVSIFTRMNTPSIYQEIGIAIKARRKQLDMTQEHLAALIGISRASLANIETGRQTVLIHHLYKIAEQLQLDIIDLLPEQIGRPMVSSPVLFERPEGLNTSQQKQVERLVAEVAFEADLISRGASKK